ncbi:Type II secretion system protein E [compost metagenome]
MAIFEVLVISRELRTAIANGAPVEEIDKLARQAGMTTLFEHGCMAVEQGKTTLEELVRMLGVPDGR